MKMMIIVFLCAICAVFPAGSQTVIRKAQEQMSIEKLNSIPDLVLPAIYNDRAAHPLPAAVDNSKLKYFAPTNWAIMADACANAAAVSYDYNYEVNCMQDSAPTLATPKYAYEYTYHFLNNGIQSTGGDGWMYVEAFDILKKTGGATSPDFGGFEAGNLCWMNGYDKYYRAMKVRANEYYKIDITVPRGDTLAKQFLYDHADQSTYGGCLVVQVCSENWTTTTISGRRTFTKIGGGGGHSLTVVGYDDAFNGGCYVLCNSWGESNPFYWAPYSLFKNGAGWYPDNSTDPKLNNKYFMCCRLKKNYSPKYVFKASITHSQRNQICIMTGAANSTTATAPTSTTDYAGAFNYSGGAYPMCGSGQSTTIEIGLDLTDFETVVAAGKGKFFLQIISNGGGTGQVNSLALEDYSGPTTREIVCTEINKTIVSGATLMSVPWTSTVNESQKPQLFADHLGNGLTAKYTFGGNAHAIQFTFPCNGTALLRIRDLAGRVVWTKEYNATVGGNTVGLIWNLTGNDGRAVSKGAYMASATVTARDGTLTRRELVTKVMVRD
jgi:hypothetical protein